MPGVSSSVDVDYIGVLGGGVSAASAKMRTGTGTGTSPSYRTADFDPASLSPFRWHDVSLQATVCTDAAGTTRVAAVNDPVLYWGDVSGNARHASRASNGGTFEYDGGLPCISFPTSAIVAKALVSTSGNIAQPLTIACVMKDQRAGDYYFFDGDGTGGRCILNSTGLFFSVYAGIDFRTSLTAEDLLAWHTHIIVFNGASSKYYIDGVLQTMNINDFGASAMQGLTLNCHNALGPDQGASSWREFIGFPSALTAAQVASVHNYLDVKW